MRTSELYQRYIDEITTIAKAPDSSSNWRAGIESVIRHFHAETMPMTRAPFRRARDDMAAELEGKARMHPDSRARDVMALAAELLRKL